MGSLTYVATITREACLGALPVDTAVEKFYNTTLIC